MEHGKPLNKAAFRKSMMIIFKQGFKRAVAQVSFYAMSPFIAEKLIGLFHMATLSLDLSHIDVVAVWRWLFGPCARKLIIDTLPFDELPIGSNMLLALVLSTVILPYALDYLDEQAQLAVEEHILAERKRAKSRLKNSIRMSLLSTKGAKSSTGKTKEQDGATSTHTHAKVTEEATSTEPHAKVTEEAAVEVAAVTDVHSAVTANVTAALHSAQAEDAAPPLSPNHAAAQWVATVKGEAQGAAGDAQKLTGRDGKEKEDFVPVTRMYWSLFGAPGKYSGTVDGDGHPHGKGQYKRADGYVGIYEGDFVHGRLEGSGVLAWIGDKYVGSFSNSLYDGFGMSTRRDGSRYQGDFAKGQLHGAGTYTFPSGAVYAGSFSHDNMHGSGRKTSADGALVHDGEWASGKPVKPPPSACPSPQTPEKSVQAQVLP
jgi:hypothetical protein